MNELIVDSFAGGGGASKGIEMSCGRSPDIAINHNPAAILMHAANHPKTRHFKEDVFKVSPRVVTKGRPVGLLWSSPDCRHFSRAKGSNPVKKSIRGLAWVVIKWAVEVGPRVIVLENVREFQDWGPVVPRWKCLTCDWKGTEGQATLLRKRPRCPRCEGKIVIEECPRDSGGGPVLIPCPDRKGLTFRKFTGRLRNLGYAVEYKVLNAADYGAPTHRRRLFLIARNDGLPIEWPAPTHGDPKKIDERDLFSGPLKPWRTAAECIDWSIPCPSIFSRKKPLADKTLRRIALGVKRYVLDNPKPFLVSQLTPFIAGVGGRAGETPPTRADAPVGTITAKNDRVLVAPVLAHLAHGDFADGSGGARSSSVEAPLGTVHSGGNNFALVSAFFAKHYGGVVGHKADQPIGTITAVDHHSLVAANLVHLNHGEKTWNKVDEPLRTVTSAPHAALVATNLVHMHHGGGQHSACGEPLPTVTGQGNHAALVYSFMVKYFGVGVGQPVTEPLHTITGKDRFGLITVMVDEEPYVIADIGMRMLRPRELANAQGFPASYILTGTATNQVERIGNSVCPAVAAAVVAANYADRFDDRRVDRTTIDD